MPSYETPSAPSPEPPPFQAPQYEAPQYGAPQYEAPQYGAPPPQPPQGGYPPPPQGGYPPPGAAQGPGAGYPPPGGGFGQPPGGYPPASGFGAAPGYGPPAGYANSDEKTWALVAHLGGAIGAFITGGLGGWIGPLIAMLAKGSQSPTVRAHAVAALNFQLLWAIVTVVGYITMCIIIGFIIVPVAWLVATIVGVIAGVKANEGQLFNYPMSISMIK